MRDRGPIDLNIKIKYAVAAAAPAWRTMAKLSNVLRTFGIVVDPDFVGAGA